MRSHLRAEPIINAKRDTPYNMKTQKEIGLLGEKVCRNFLIDCCAKHRFGFVRFEDVRDVKMYQERDIDFIVYTSSGKTITLDAKADTYTTGNIFLEIYVPGFKLGKNGVPIAKYTENGERAGQKRQAVLQAYDDYQKAVASVTLAENRQLVDKIEQLLQKVNTETNRELAAYGIMERQLRNSLASGTSQELAVSQKLLLSAAVIARSAKEISLYMDFISLAKAFQNMAKSVKTSQPKVSEDDTVKAAVKKHGEAAEEWENAKEALHKAEAELEKQEMQKALYESNLRTREKRVTSYDAILSNIQKAQQEKRMQSIEKERSSQHREVFIGGHNAVRSKKQTDTLLNEDVSKLSNADIEKVLSYIRTNAKTFRQKLRKLYMTQQKRQIDVKATIEKSTQCDGEIAKLYYKKPVKSKANIVMLADISGSCRTMTSLALTYMGLMREVFPGGCHLFVFVNHLVPVDRYFSNENVTAAVESINKNVPSRGIYSNYGVPLKELRYDNTGIINKDTTIVMLGDCRNNKNYSGVEEVEWLSKRASNFFVLNPDPLNKWGQGDSIADLYAKSGATVCRVSSTQDLLTFLESASLRKHA